MQDKKSQFIRLYQRSSKSPWNDASTILLYATVVKTSNSLELEFDRFIYLHRDTVGRVLGVSIAKSLLDSHPEFESKYLEGIDMYSMLLQYLEDIIDFTNHFADEFQQLFMLDPKTYFEAAALNWCSIIEDV